MCNCQLFPLTGFVWWFISTNIILQKHFFALNLICSGCSHFVCSVPVKNRKCLAHEAEYTSACLACSIPVKTGNVWLMMQYTLLPLILAFFTTSQKQAATSARHKIMALESVLSPLWSDCWSALLMLTFEMKEYNSQHSFLPIIGRVSLTQLQNCPECVFFHSCQ